MGDQSQLLLYTQTDSSCEPFGSRATDVLPLRPAQMNRSCRRNVVMRSVTSLPEVGGGGIPASLTAAVTATASHWGCNTAGFVSVPLLCP